MIDAVVGRVIVSAENGAELVNNAVTRVREVV